MNRIASTKVRDRYGTLVKISTVRLPMDHNFSQHGPPLLFETIIFGGMDDGYCRRYSTRAEAKIGHKETVDAIVYRKRLTTDAYSHILN